MIKLVLTMGNRREGILSLNGITSTPPALWSNRTVLTIGRVLDGLYPERGKLQVNTRGIRQEGWLHPTLHARDRQVRAIGLYLGIQAAHTAPAETRFDQVTKVGYTCPQGLNSGIHRGGKMTDQDRPLRPSELAHTFSITARDPQSGHVGVAVQSHWFSVGSVVTWAEAGVGAVATQAMVEISYGPLGLDLMRGGKPAPQALEALLTADEGRALRQVSMVDTKGRIATHTGKRCIADAGHTVGEGFSTQANMMGNPDVWPAMADAYRNATAPLPERMVTALEAGQEAGGDIRGKQSAALLVVAAESSGRPWADTVVELRIEDHPEPIRELRRLLTLHRAYEHMNHGDELLGRGDVEAALEAYQNAATMAPQITELPFWQAVTLADLGRIEEALPIFRAVFAENPDWRTLVQRLPASGLLRDDLKMMEQIVSLDADT
jgi:uncharacterized Ntn-hydrolase superfamily protein